MIVISIKVVSKSETFLILIASDVRKSNDPSLEFEPN